MIINIRGTHGAGKTTLVRQVLAECRRRKPVFIEGRKNPIGYVCDKRLFVVGHYEGDASGGCDTIPKTDLMFKMIRRYAKKGMDVLFEGILAQHSFPRIVALREAGFKVRVIQLDIPVKKAIKSVKHRRRKRGETTPFNSANLEREAQALLRSAERLRDAKIRVKQHTTRQSARAQLFSLLDLS